MTTETQSEIIKALEDMGLSMSYVCVSPGNAKTESRWRVTISRGGRDFTSKYIMGCAHRRWTPQGVRAMAKEPKKFGPWNRGWFESLYMESFRARYSEPIPPDLADVMYSLVMDTSGVRDGQSFEDWCADYGSDPDSIKALESFNACTDAWRAMVRLGLDLDALSDLFQDY